MEKGLIVNRFAVTLAPAVLIIGASGCISTPPADDRVWNLTLTGNAGQVLSLAAVRGLPAVEGYGFGVSTVGIKIGPNRYRGVPMTDLTAKVGGLGPGDVVYDYAADGYLGVFGAGPLEGAGFITFNGSLKEIPAPPLRVILAYERDGEPLPDDEGGPLRAIIVADSPDVIVEASSWVKWVDRIEIHRK